MINIAICDDEKIFQEKIKECVSAYIGEKNKMCTVTVFSSGEEMCSEGSDISQFSVFFLDIDMGNMNGIEVAKRIRGVNSKAYIVFVTAYLEYSLDGYKVEAVRYILKERKTLEKAIRECMDTIFRKMQDSNTEKIIVFQEGKIKIDISQILYVESCLHKLKVHVWGTELKSYTLCDKLDNFEYMLAKDYFLRVHQSYLVNIKFVSTIKNRVLYLSNGFEIIIPKARYREVLNRFVVYKGEI